MTLISEKGVTVSEKIDDVGALIEAEKESKKSKMTENPTTYAYDVYYDYNEVLCSHYLCPSQFINELHHPHDTYIQPE